MADGPKSVDIALSWVGVEDLPVHFANAFAGIVGPNAVYLNIGSVVPPSISGGSEEEREAQVRAIPYVPIKPIARIALTPQGLDEMIQSLEETRKNHQTLMDAIHNQEQR